MSGKGRRWIERIIFKEWHQLIFAALGLAIGTVIIGRWKLAILIFIVALALFVFEPNVLERRMQAKESNERGADSD